MVKRVRVSLSLSFSHKNTSAYPPKLWLNNLLQSPTVKAWEATSLALADNVSFRGATQVTVRLTDWLPAWTTQLSHNRHLELIDIAEVKMTLLIWKALIRIESLQTLRMVMASPSEEDENANDPFLTVGFFPPLRLGFVAGWPFRSQLFLCLPFVFVVSN